MSPVRCHLITALLLVLAVAGCASPKPERGSVPVPDVGYVSSPEALLRHIQTLASDQFGGRSPGTEGEALSISYLAAQFRGFGLRSPAADGSFTQEVPLVGISSRPHLELE